MRGDCRKDFNKFLTESQQVLGGAWEYKHGFSEVLTQVPM